MSAGNWIKAITRLVIINLVFSSTCFAQNFNLSVNQQPLSEILKDLSEKHEAKIAYDSELASKIIVSGNFSGATLKELIEKIIVDSNLDLVIINEVLVIRPKRIVETEPEEKVKPPPPLEFKLLGVVRDEKTLERLPYATIAIAGTNRGTTTNSDGYFSIITQQADSLNLIISYLGYQPTKISLVPKNQKEQIKIDLTTQENVIETAVIVKHQPDIVATESSPGMIRWNSNRNTDMPSMNGLDIAAPLQLLPGIDGTTESLSGLLIRKSTSDKNLFVFDGFTIYHIDHFFGAFTSFNAKSVKDIRVFKGGFDAQWGGRASSVIEITGKTGNSNSLSVDAGADLLSTDILLEGPMGKKFTFLVAARRSFTDFFRSNVYYQFLESARSDILLASKNYPAFLRTDEDEPNFVYSDFNTKISYKPTEKDNLSLTAFSGTDRMRLDRETGYQTLSEDSDWGNGGVGFRWSRQWNSKFYHTFTAGTSRYHLNFEHTDYTLKKRQNSSIIDTVQRYIYTLNELNDINISWNNSLKLNERNTLEFGLQTNGVNIKLDEEIKHITNDIPIIDTVRTRDNKMFHSTIWSQYTYSSGIVKSLKFGVRASHYGPTDKNYLEPRVQASVEFAKNSFLKFSAGKYYQFINQIVTYSAYNFQRAWVISDGDRFPVVSANHLIGGVITKLPAGITVDVEFYKKKMENITLLQTVYKRVGNGAGGNRIQEQQVYYNITNNVKGMDLLLHKEFPSAQVWLAYTLSRSTNIAETVNRGNPYPAFDDQLHEVKLAGTAKWRGWGIAFATIYGSGKPWDEILFTNTLQISSDYEKNSNRLPAYFRTDLGVNYTKKFSRGEVKAGVNVFNILNRENILARPYAISDTPVIDFLQTGTPLVYNDLYGMGIAQSVFVNFKF